MLQPLQNIEHEHTAPELPDEFEKGQVYTPKFLASWVSLLLKEHLSSAWSGSLLDPACGDGELLVAFTEVLPRARVLGVDIDPTACAVAQNRLGPHALVKNADMLDSNCHDLSVKFRKIDAIISNPPWGADLLKSPEELRNTGFELAHGQFDSWSVFVEHSLRLLQDNGVAAFILPDAVFSLEHTHTRKLISNRYSILLIARLGEGIFNGICRGTTVLLVKKELPNSSHEVEAFRLPRSKLTQVLTGKCKLDEIRKTESHRISQHRFMSDPDYRWDIDVRTTDLSILDRMEAMGGSWSDYLISGRGVELSKRGIVKECSSCGSVVPEPRIPRYVECSGCGKASFSEEMQTQTIVESKGTKQKGFMNFVVGEDVGRYSLSCSRQLKMDVPGINYKNEIIYHNERLLVRKTGIGLRATITQKSAISNQVVFHYTPTSKKYRFFLYYVLGILCSRTLFAYHLKKSGENEWRSHPYITPRTLSTLPIPVPVEGDQMWNQAKAISNQVAILLKKGGNNFNQDIKIESLVAGLYRLNPADIEWVKSTICSAQNLQAVRSLGNFNPKIVKPNIIKK